MRLRREEGVPSQVRQTGVNTSQTRVLYYFSQYLTLSAENCRQAPRRIGMRCARAGPCRPDRGHGALGVRIIAMPYAASQWELRFRHSTGLASLDPPARWFPI